MWLTNKPRKGTHVCGVGRRLGSTPSGSSQSELQRSIAGKKLNDKGLHDDVDNRTMVEVTVGGIGGIDMIQSALGEPL